MKYLNFVWLSLVMAFRWSCGAVKKVQFQVTNLTCENLSYPLGIVGSIPFLVGSFGLRGI